MRPTIEAVPNISEGRDPEKVAEIVRAAEVTGVSLLHVDVGPSANRTVVTIAGEPEPVAESLFRLVERTVALVDLTAHVGTHPRIGAADVVPLVPLRDVTTEECVRAAVGLGSRIAAELSLPVYFYEEAATAPARRSLPYLRRGGFEALPTRMLEPGLAPDLGGPRPHPTAGVVVVGARRFLVAYNVHLATRSVETARRVAAAVRTAVPAGTPPSRLRLPALRAIGWFAEEYDCAEVSCNLTDLSATGLLEAFEAVALAAAAEGTSVTGSEIIGLCPREALLAVGRTLVRRSAARGGPDAGLEAAAAEYLGLSSRRPFETARRTVEGALDRPLPWDAPWSGGAAS